MATHSPGITGKYLTQNALKGQIPITLIQDLLNNTGAQKEIKQ